MYGLSGVFGSNLFSYNSVSTSAYRRLLQSQYGSSRAGNTRSSTRASYSGRTQTSPYSEVINSAENLTSDALRLNATGKKNIFLPKQTVDADGNKVQSYDKDAIYSAVKSFVNDYNSTIDKALYSGNSSIQSTAANMSNTTRIMSKSLSDVGISLGRDGKLSVDEGSFKNSDMTKVRGLFSGAGSYGQTISSAASRLSSVASYQSNRAQTDYGSYGGLYGLSGSYGSTGRNSGFSNYLNYYSMFNGLF